uniref:Uncharacterized protein n=3 Tax=Oryza TaxID=4527 RepID=A0A0D3HPU5_9ORYZ|nr:hypothetical protein [Oryza barthii]BBF89458.1 hypothetical protein [Oryza glaberrima]
MAMRLLKNIGRRAPASMACVSSAFSAGGCGLQILPATTAAGVAFSETSKGYSELKQMYEAFCFNPGLYDSDTGCDEYVKRMRAIVELVCCLEKEGQDCSSCTIEWDSERDLPIVPRWTPSARARTMTVGDRHALLAAAIVVAGAATLVAGAAVVSRQK